MKALRVGVLCGHGGTGGGGGGGGGAGVAGSVVLRYLRAADKVLPSAKKCFVLLCVYTE